MTLGHRTDVAPASRLFRRYAIGLLLAIFVLNFFDRQIVNIIAEPIKHELRLADWQIGLMTGFAFALLNAVCGLPLAHLADRWNRTLVLAGSVAVWSGFTALCGGVSSFGGLILARLGVGAGEAGCTPVAQSLICDYFPREKRASALAIYHLGVPLGSLLGLALGGVLADAYGWRTAFLLAGAPGLVFALLAATTLREPRRTLASALLASSQNAGRFRETLKFVARKPSFWLVNLGAALKAFISYGQAPFATMFFLRVHGAELNALARPFHLHAAGFLGVVLGLIGAVGGGLGIWTGGQIADRAATRDPRAYCVIPAISAIAVVPFAIAVYWAHDVGAALALMIAPSFIGSLWFGPVHTVETSVVRPRMRATASAIQTLMVNFIGLGLGPVTVGLLSDLFGHRLGLGSGEGVRWALTVSSFLALPAFALFWAARRTIRADLEP